MLIDSGRQFVVTVFVFMSHCREILVKNKIQCIEKGLIYSKCFDDISKT